MRVGNVWLVSVALVAVLGCSERPSIPEIARVCGAAERGELDKVKALVEAKPRLAGASHPAAGGWTALHVAGTKEVAEYLLAKGADVDATDPNDVTPLHKQAGAGRREVVELLLARGADVNVTAAFAMTPLHYAANSCQPVIVELLLKKGARVDARTTGKGMVRGGRTPLILAANSTRPTRKATVEVLIAHGADVNAQCEQQWTALHTAAHRGAADVVEVLLAKGANPNAEDNEGKTPWDAAWARGRKEIMDLLERHGGKPGPGRGPVPGFRDARQKDYRERMQKRGAAK
jgi:ankyrin repeat protein